MIKLKDFLKNFENSIKKDKKMAEKVEIYMENLSVLIKKDIEQGFINCMLDSRNLGNNKSKEV